MRISKDDVKKIADLARLDLTEAEIEKYQAQLEQILDYVQKLNELDTENTEPTYTVHQADHHLREDKVKPSLPREKVMENAPAHSHGFVRVPKVIQ